MAPTIMITMASMLTLVPPNPTPTPESFDVSDVEITSGPDSIQWSTFDANGDQSGEILIASDGETGATLDATFADGLYLVAIIDAEGRIVDADSPDAREVFERLTAVTDIDAAHGDDPHSEVMCYAGLLAAGSCFIGAILPCMGSGFVISCHCLPIVNGTPTPGCD